MSKKSWIILWAGLGASLAAFLVVLFCVVGNQLAPLGIDTAIANWAYSVRGEKGGAVYWFFRLITEFGYTYFIILIILIMGIIWKFKSRTWFFAGTILCSWILQKIIKFIIDRPRPDEALWWMSEGSSSFPSGHSICVACVFILLCYFICTSPAVKSWVKYLVCTLSAAIMFLVPLSRIILGVHYFTDVLGGLFFGTFVAILGIMCDNWYIDRKNKKASAAIPSSNIKDNKMSGE